MFQAFPFLIKCSNPLPFLPLCLITPGCQVPRRLFPQIPEGRRDKYGLSGSLGIISICYIIQSPYQHPGSSDSLSYSKLPPAPGLPSSQSQSFFLEPCCFTHALCLPFSVSLPSLSLLSCLLPLYAPAPSASAHLMSESGQPCSVFFLFLPWTLLIGSGSSLSYIKLKTFPLTISWTSHVIILYTSLLTQSC